MKIQNPLHLQSQSSPQKCWNSHHAITIATSNSKTLIVTRYFSPPLTGILTDITKTFHMSESQSGLLQTAFVLVYMVMAPVFGYLGDRFSRKYLMAVGIFFWCLATLVGSFMPVSVNFDGSLSCFYI